MNKTNPRDYGFMPYAKTAQELYPVTPETDLDVLLSSEELKVIEYLKAVDFKGKPGEIVTALGDSGQLVHFVGIKSYDDMYALAALPDKLKPGKYQISPHILNEITPEQQTKMTLGWALGCYKFEKFKSEPQGMTRFLKPPRDADIFAVMRQAEAAYMVRDLINRPTNDLGTSALAQEAISLAQTFNATVHPTIAGTKLKEEFRLIHEVGKAGQDQPYLVDFTWGDENAPKVTLVGKGVVYDTGGLDKKPGGKMNSMRGDMGGAANVLGLARMIMQAELPVRLRVMIPIAENAISENAMRPHDIVPSKRLKGNIRIGHTDAEGRLVLAEPLAAAASEKPELLIDMATLTGAARSALGVMPALFSSDTAIARDLMDLGKTLQDPLWHMPLFEAEADMAPALRDHDADFISDPDNGRPDHINAALWLKNAIERGAKDPFDKTTWLHVDFNGMNAAAKPGRPEGGAEIAIRTLYSYVENRFNPE